MCLSRGCPGARVRLRVTCLCNLLCNVRTVLLLMGEPGGFLKCLPADALGCCVLSPPAATTWTVSRHRQVFPGGRTESSGNCCPRRRLPGGPAQPSIQSRACRTNTSTSVFPPEAGLRISHVCLHICWMEPNRSPVGSFCPKPRAEKDRVRPREDYNPQPLRIKPSYRVSLVVQWLRIRLPMQGTRVQALVR